MRKLLLLPLFAFATIGAADSCETETKDEPDPVATITAPPQTTTTPEKAGVGDSITLEGNTEGTRIAVRLLRIIDPLQGGEFDDPDPGTRFVGVRVQLRNVGETTYDDSPSNGATLIMSGDEQAESELLTGGSCSSSFGSSAKISPGSKQVGCLAFAVREGKRPVRFQFALDSGFGPANGEWTVRP